MKKPKTKKQFIKKMKKELSLCDWDDLAYIIICLEHAMLTETDDKAMKLLEIKIEICESFKLDKVNNSFDMEYFMNKEFPYLEDEDFDY